jgi:hypothetical protein
MDQIPKHILLQMQQEQDQELENPSGIKESKINSILNNDVTKLDGVAGDGVLKTDNDDSEDGDDNDGNSDKKDVGGKTEEEIEEADFVSWFGSLKEEEAVSPKEEAVQVITLTHTMLCFTVLLPSFPWYASFGREQDLLQWLQHKAPSFPQSVPPFPEPFSGYSYESYSITHPPIFPSITLTSLRKR